jgi:hypothetical protein
MLNQQTKKSHNQRKAMRRQQHQIIQLQQERFLLIHRVAEQSKVVREQMTTSVNRDGFPSDLSSSSFMRESRRLRALHARLDYLTNKIQRIKN